MTGGINYLHFLLLAALRFRIFVAEKAYLLFGTLMCATQGTIENSDGR